MNFNIYVNKEVGEKVSKIAKTMNRSRNSIVNEALKEWLDKRSESKWPKGFFDFEAVNDDLDFKELRKMLKENSKKDPLA